MDRRTALKFMGAGAAMAGAGLSVSRAAAADAVTIALIPGLTDGNDRRTLASRIPLAKC